MEHLYPGRETLEKKILLGTLRGAMIITALYGCNNIYQHDYPSLVAAVIFILAFGGCYLFIVATNGSALSRRITVGLAMLSITSGFFFQGGLRGINALDFCGLTIMITIALSGTERFVFLFLFLIQFFCVAIIQYYHLEWISDSGKNDPIIIDIAEVLARVGNFLYIGFLYKSEFERKRAHVFEANTRLQEVNAEVSIQNEVIATSNNQLELMVYRLKQEQQQTMEAKAELEKAHQSISKQNQYITGFNLQLKEVVLDLKRERQAAMEAKERLEEANTEINAQSEVIASYNRLLEEKVSQRTAAIEQLNKKLIEYAFANAHRIRGPLARVLGLINLMKLSAGETGKQINSDDLDYLDKLDRSANELDDVVKEMSLILQEETTADL